MPCERNPSTMLKHSPTQKKQVCFGDIAGEWEPLHMRKKNKKGNIAPATFPLKHLRLAKA